MHIHRMNGDGTVGAEIDRRDWSSGWMTVKFYTVGGGTYLFLLKEGNGKVHVLGINNGTVGNMIASYDWTSRSRMNWPRSSFGTLRRAPGWFVVQGKVF